MKTSLKEYIDGLDLTPEQKAVLAPVLANQKVVDAIDKDLKGAQSEISRQFDLAKKKNADYFAEVSAWKAEKDREFTEKSQQFQKAHETVAQYKARLESLVASGVIDSEDVKDLMDAAKVDPPPKKDPPVVDPKDSPYVSREQFAEEARQMAQLTAAMNDLSAEHAELFGKPPKNLQAVLARAIEEKKPLREVFDETYKIAERRQELAAEATKRREDEIRREERQKVMSEFSNPTARPESGVNSPVLKEFAKVDKTDSATGAMRGVLAAVQAHSNGKYAGGVEQKTS